MIFMQTAAGDVLVDEELAGRLEHPAYPASPWRLMLIGAPPRAFIGRSVGRRNEYLGQVAARLAGMPEGFAIRYANGNSLDCRVENLRLGRHLGAPAAHRTVWVQPPGVHRSRVGGQGPGELPAGHRIWRHEGECFPSRHACQAEGRREHLGNLWRRSGGRGWTAERAGGSFRHFTGFFAGCDWVAGLTGYISSSDQAAAGESQAVAA